MDTIEEKNFKFHHLIATFSVIVNKTSVGETENVKSTNDEQVSTNDTVHPLERYMCISAKTRIMAFFNTVSKHDIVLGTLVNVLGMSVKLVSVLHGKHRWIHDLHIMARVELSDEHTRRRRDTDEDNDFEVGDKVKGIVVNVDSELQMLKISFNDELLKKDQIKFFPLGKLDENDEVNNALLDRDSEDLYDGRKSLLKDLHRSSAFMNPNCVQNLVNYLCINDRHKSFLLRSASRTSLPHISVEILREKQSYKWSMDMVGVGVKHFRADEQKEAMKCFDQAISFYPKNVEGYVARGALKANRSELKTACEDFREALKLNPKHRNGTKYLIETLSTMAKGFERQRKWKDASRCYKEIMDLDPDHKEAEERFQQIKQILSHKILTAGSVATATKSSLSDVSKEKLSQLKKLLQEETKDSEVSSSSTSSSSSSETDSDDDWVEKTSKKTKREHYGEESSSKQDRRAVRRYQDYVKSSSKPEEPDSENVRRENIDQTLLKKLRNFSSDEFEIMSKLLHPNDKKDSANDSIMLERKSRLRTLNDDEHSRRPLESGTTISRDSVDRKCREDQEHFEEVRDSERDNRLREERHEKSTERNIRISDHRSSREQKSSDDGHLGCRATSYRHSDDRNRFERDFNEVSTVRHKGDWNKPHKRKRNLDEVSTVRHKGDWNKPHKRKRNLDDRYHVERESDKSKRYAA